MQKAVLQGSQSEHNVSLLVGTVRMAEIACILTTKRICTHNVFTQHLFTLLDLLRQNRNDTTACTGNKNDASNFTNFHKCTGGTTISWVMLQDSRQRKISKTRDSQEKPHSKMDAVLRLQLNFSGS